MEVANGVRIDEKQKQKQKRKRKRIANVGEDAGSNASRKRTKKKAIDTEAKCLADLGKKHMKPMKDVKFVARNEDVDSVVRSGSAEDHAKLLSDAYIRIFPKEKPMVDVYIPSGAAFLVPEEISHDIAGLPGCLDEARSALGIGNGSAGPGCPQILILTISARRSMDVVRSVRAWSPKPIAKLFAKHIKVEEQRRFLSSTEVDVGVGTPARVEQLCTEGALNLDSLKFLVIDMFRDLKGYSIIQLRDTGVSFFNLFKKQFSDRAREGSLSVLLF